MKFIDIPVLGRLARRIRDQAKGAPSRKGAGNGQPAPRRLTAAEQWQRLSGLLTGAIADADRAGSLQVRACQQIDLATYALYNLIDELALVMHEPIRREKASIHQLSTASVAATGPVRSARRAARAAA